MSKPIISQPIQKPSLVPNNNNNNNISTNNNSNNNSINANMTTVSNAINTPLQIQPKPVMTVLQTSYPSRIQQQPAFAIQPNNHHLTSISSIRSPQNLGISPATPITLTLAPIAAKPVDNNAAQTNSVSMIPSNFQPIQMRPSNNAVTKQPPLPAPISSTNASSAAAGGYYREWILESIDKLRERKARPDAERISTLMKRYHNIPLEDTVMCLNKLADSGAVVCVDYKGNISYRNPYKWRKNSANGGGIMNPPSITNRILEAMKHLDKSRNIDPQNPHKVGYSIAEIEQALNATQIPNVLELTKSQLRHCLEREAQYGKLLRRADCTFVIDESGEKRKHKTPALQAKKAAITHKPIANKTLVAAPPQPITIATTSQILPNISASPAPIPSNSSSFATFSVQPLTTYQTPQVAPFMTTSDRPIYPMLAATPAPYPSMTINTVSQPSPILPKQTAPLNFVKCEAQSPPIESHSQPILPTLLQAPPIMATNIVTTTAMNNQILPSTQSNDTVTVAKETPISATVAAAAQSFVASTAAAAEMKAFGKTSRRGRPPGSKNKRYQDSDNGAINPPTKKTKVESCDANNITSISAGSSCSALSVTNSDQTVPAIGPVVEICWECKLPQTEYEKFLCCKDCPVKVHPSCLHYWPELTERARQSLWQCSACKTCCICKDRSSKESVYICDGCDKGFHSNCHEPKIQEPISRNAAWICSNCYKEGFRIRVEDSMKSEPSTVSKVTKDSPDVPETKCCIEKPLVDIKKECVNFEENTKENIAKIRMRPDDVTKWTVEDVCEWLNEEGFGSQSASFRDQEIDGACLLLMKRMDVLTELNIKLGPAVKIYERIKKIQNDGSIWKYDDCF